jgi:hypothetical protein
MLDSQKEKTTLLITLALINERRVIEVILFVDIDRDYRGREDCVMTIHRLNTESGVHKPIHYKGQCLSSYALTLFNHISADLPLASQVIFDKHSFGIAVYDSLVKLMDKSKHIGMRENGTLYFK